MSDDPSGALERSSTNGSENSSSFRSFWKKSDGRDGAQKVQFIEQDPGQKRKSNRVSRLLRQGSAASTERGPLEEDPATSALKRREQVYHAQKRHRDRKAEYVRTLEAEVARLQHIDAVVNSEKNALAHQNEAMKAFLASQSLDVHLGSVDLSSPSAPSEDLSLLGGAWIDVRFDPEIGHERTFMDLDMPEPVWSSTDTSESQQQGRRPTRGTPINGDSWAALDFILALEWPCQGHIPHAINPGAFIPKVCEESGAHGHALTATRAVYESALPPPSTRHECSQCSHTTKAVQDGLLPTIREKWQLPHSEIDKLVELSEQLQLDDELMTPAQAYAMIRKELPSDDLLVPVLDMLKLPLASIVECLGFGAVMPSAKFYQHLDETLQTLEVTNSV
ncbi:hypothetical protein LTR85_004684 [Meristemomyces frigidus]|nr:hypothetical protein LTR85_004684 [Meristemomyces frigidus]